MKQGEILFFLGSMCIVVFAWIAFTILHDSLTSTIGQQTMQAIIPIQPTFDIKTIEAMKSRTAIAPLYIIQPPSQDTLVVTTASATALPISSVSISPIPSASSGGQLQ